MPREHVSPASGSGVNALAPGRAVLHTSRFHVDYDSCWCIVQLHGCCNPTRTKLCVDEIQLQVLA